MDIWDLKCSRDTNVDILKRKLQIQSEEERKGQEIYGQYRFIEKRFNFNWVPTTHQALS